ncbi:response regulator transcription factor [Pararhodobacter sp. SW119]|uniref:response regulator transcription factor n=1 Tax=Pararhodobacter sp. SW119 TaxID=2780075 RepID=UPI001AE0DCB3
MQPTVMVLDDDEAVLRLVETALAEEGCTVVCGSTIGWARAALQSRHVDLCIVDLDLPDGSGLTLVEDLRQRAGTGIIILTGRTDEMDQVQGFELGADDYIAKPFRLRELRARVNAVLRRTQPTRIQTDNSVPAPDHRFGSYRVFLGARQVLDANGNEVALTPMEFDALVAFLHNPNAVLSRDQLMTAIRGRDWFSYDRSIDGLVSRLRAKLPAAEGQRPHIATIYGVGYCFRPVESG